jgi:hypothetical protein
MSKVLLQIENLKPTITHNLLFMWFESDSVTLLLMDENYVTLFSMDENSNSTSCSMMHAWEMKGKRLYLVNTKWRMNYKVLDELKV